MGTANQVKVFTEQRPSRIGPISGSFILTEATGALGDLGTFVPLVIGLVVLVGMDPATILVFAGLANIVTGLVFRVPIPVQPMKAIAALAIVGVMTAEQVSMAGVLVGGALLVLVSLGLIEQLDRVIPRPVIRGIQLAVAARLGLKALQLGFFDQFSHSLRPLWGSESLTVLVVCIILVILFRRQWQWAALGLILIGCVLAIVKGHALPAAAHITMWRPTLLSFNDFSISASLRGAITQMPLTLLNSVFAVSLLAGKLFPNSTNRTTPTKTAISVGLMNLFTCPFGAMPICHGSGGMAGQYAFGARSGLSMVMLGTIKLIMGLLFGSVVLAWMQAFPVTILAVFLLLAGVTLAQTSRFWQNRIDLVVAIITVIVYFATGFLPAGFVAGWVTHVIWSRAIEKRRLLSAFGRPEAGEKG